MPPPPHPRGSGERRRLHVRWTHLVGARLGYLRPELRSGGTPVNLAGFTHKNQGFSQDNSRAGQGHSCHLFVPHGQLHLPRRETDAPMAGMPVPLPSCCSCSDSGNTLWALHTCPDFSFFP